LYRTLSIVLTPASATPLLAFFRRSTMLLSDAIVQYGYFLSLGRWDQIRWNPFRNNGAQRLWWVLSRLKVYLVALNPFSKKDATWHDDGSVIAFGSNTHTTSSIMSNNTNSAVIINNKRKITGSRSPATTTTRISLWTALLIAIVAVGLGLLLAFFLTTREPPQYQQECSAGIKHDSHQVVPLSTGRTTDSLSSLVALDNGDCTCHNAENAAAADADSTISFAAAMGLNGTISDCCCSFADLERANIDIIYPLLQQTVATPFFAHFKIDLLPDCPLWNDQPVCMLRDCSVCEVDVPPVWAAQVDWMPPSSLLSDQQRHDDCDDNDDYYNTEDRIVTTVDWHVRKDWSASPTSFFDPPQVNDIASFGMPVTTADSASAAATTKTARDDDGADATAVVVDLRLNLERYTGYGGASAAKVWSAVHLDNCFQQPPQPPPPHDDNDDASDNADDESSYCSLPSEQRIYNRVISGMHSSISLHIAHSYCLEMDPDRSGECQTWGLNPDLAQTRVLQHRERLENLYVAFAVLLRAVQKAGPAIAAAVPHHDDFYATSLSEWSDHLWPELSRLAQTCPTAFDETNLLTTSDNNARPQLLSRRIRHLQQIMQCVGCDRCKLWGTLQTLGIGTALRILLPPSSDGGLVGDVVSSSSSLTLSRQEAVALVHTLERFSSAVVFADELRRVPKQPKV
jgi:ERO1-like protein alpha